MHDLAPQALIEARKVVVAYQGSRQLWKKRRLRAVDEVDLQLSPGEVHALVGESGSGKSTLGRVLASLQHPTSGKVFFQGQDVESLRGRALRRHRRRIGVVFQNPFSSLNPKMTVGRALAEPLRVWHLVEADEVRGAVEELILRVGLPANYAARYPHQLSGGECQRIAIARAIAVGPDFLVADEPVSSLDVSAAAEILNLFMSLQEELALACLFVTHDLGIADAIAPTVSVMRRGRVVESGKTADVFRDPQHDYTKKLVASRLERNSDFPDYPAPTASNLD